MDGYAVLALIIFCITVIALVAIVFGQSDVASKAVTGLSNVLKAFTGHSNKG